MDTNIRRLLKEIGAEDLIEVFAPCMDDYRFTEKYPYHFTGSGEAF